MEALGLDIKLLVAQLINFLVLFIVVRKILYKPIITILDERKRKAEEIQKSHQEIEEKMSQMEEKQKLILQQAQEKAHQEQENILTLANSEKRTILDQARQAAERESQRGIERIQLAETQAAAGLKKKIVDELLDELTNKLTKQKKSSVRYQLLNEALKS